MTTKYGRPPSGVDRPPSERQDEAQDNSVGAPADIRAGYGVLRVFDYLDAVAAAFPAPGVVTGSKAADHKLLRTAITLARHSDGLTGTRVLIDWPRTAELLGVSQHTLERRVEALAELGLLFQTHKAAPGRLAEYALTGPVTFARNPREVGERSSANSERKVGGRSGRNVRQNPGKSFAKSERKVGVPPQGTKKKYPPTPQDPVTPQVSSVTTVLAAMTGEPVDRLDRVCRRVVAGALGRGWSPGQIVNTVTRESLATADNAGAVLHHRISNLDEPPPARGPHECRWTIDDECADPGCTATRPQEDRTA